MYSYPHSYTCTLLINYSYFVCIFDTVFCCNNVGRSLACNDKKTTHTHTHTHTLIFIIEHTHTHTIVHRTHVLVSYLVEWEISTIRDKRTTLWLLRVSKRLFLHLFQRNAGSPLDEDMLSIDYMLCVTVCALNMSCDHSMLLATHTIHLTLAPLHTLVPLHTLAPLYTLVPLHTLAPLYTLVPLHTLPPLYTLSPTH